MKKKDSKGRVLSRRTILPIIGGSLLMPFAGFSDTATEIADEDQYEILLKPDGTTVKVKKSVINTSEVVDKKISNKSLLKWLKKS